MKFYDCYCSILIFIILSSVKFLCPVHATLFPQDNGEIHCPVYLTLPLFAADNNYEYDPNALKTLYVPNGLSLVQVKQSYSVTNILAAILAIGHINTNNGEVIDELGSIEFQSCNIKIPTLSIIDEDTTPIPRESNGNNHNGIDVPDGLLFMPGFSSDHINASYYDDGANSYLPCVAIGPFSSKNTYDASFLMSRLGVPLISPFASLQYEDSAKDGRLVLSLGADIEVAVDSMLSYLNEIERNYVAILHEDDKYGNNFTSLLINRANDLKLAYISRAFSLSDGVESDLRSQFSEISSLGFRTIVMILSSDTTSGSSTYVDIARLTVEMSMDDSGYMWILHSSENARYLEPFVYASSESIIHKFFQGLAFIDMAFRHHFDNETDPFEISFTSSVDEILNVLKSHGFLESRMSGLSDNIVNEFHKEALSMKNKSLAFGEARVIYDSIVVAALGACNVKLSGSRALSDINHFDAMMHNPVIKGASGAVLFNNTTRFRSKNTTRFCMTNVRAMEEGRNVVQLGITQTSEYESGSWSSIEGFMYKDGTFAAPQPLRYVDSLHSDSLLPIQIIFQLLFGILFLFMSWIAMFTQNNSDLNTVKGCSSLYIYMLCALGYLWSLGLFLAGMTSHHMSAFIACKLLVWVLHISIALDTSLSFIKVRIIIRRSACWITN